MPTNCGTYCGECDNWGRGATNWMTEETLWMGARTDLVQVQLLINIRSLLKLRLLGKGAQKIHGRFGRTLVSKKFWFH